MSNGDKAPLPRDEMAIGLAWERWGDAREKGLEGSRPTVGDGQLTPPGATACGGSAARDEDGAQRQERQQGGQRQPGGEQGQGPSRQRGASHGLELLKAHVGRG